MDRYPTPEEVFDALGDKATLALGDAVAAAREDLARYRGALPEFVADHSSRGLAAWVHDRLWAHAVAALGDVDGVSFVDSGPVRDIYVRTEFRLRLKRHSKTGAVRSYPTASALEFISQEPDLLSLIGIRTLNLIAGYEWDDATRTVGDAVVSLRDGSFEEVIWVTPLPSAGDSSLGASTSPIRPTGNTPATPIIDVPRYDTATEEGTDHE